MRRVTALDSHGEAALRGGLATATLPSASAVATEKDRAVRLDGSRDRARPGG